MGYLGPRMCAWTSFRRLQVDRRRCGSITITCEIDDPTSFDESIQDGRSGSYGDRGKGRQKLPRWTIASSLRRIVWRVTGVFMCTVVC